MSEEKKDEHAAEKFFSKYIDTEKTALMILFRKNFEKSYKSTKQSIQSIKDDKRNHNFYFQRVPDVMMKMYLTKFDFVDYPARRTEKIAETLGEFFALIEEFICTTHESKTLIDAKVIEKWEEELFNKIASRLKMAEQILRKISDKSYIRIDKSMIKHQIEHIVKSKGNDITDLQREFMLEQAKKFI